MSLAFSGEQPRSALEFSGVWFSYGKTPVLKGVSFHVHEKKITALTGKNGAGKTTILKLILGLEKPQAGSISIFGKPASRARSSIGYVPQQASFDRDFPISVREAVLMGRSKPFSRKRTAEDFRAADEALAQTETLHLAKRSYSSLSGGQRRRVLVARALASKPAFLIMDEPTANMDEESEERLSSTLASLKGSTTILLVTHDSDFVSLLTDEVLCIGHGSEGAAASVVRHLAKVEGSAKRVDHSTTVAECGCAQTPNHT